LFDDVHRWNRANIPGYREIYIQAPMSVLISRDQRGIYTNAAGERAANVVGVDLPAEIPKSPDLVVTNDGLTTPDTIAQMIAETFAAQS
jgi:adenylylsulfate kinase